jgi:hypothetical protein
VSSSKTVILLKTSSGSSAATSGAVNSDVRLVIDSISMWVNALVRSGKHDFSAVHVDGFLVIRKTEL